MANFIDYVKANAGQSFEDLPLNEVDIACLNELGYLPLGEWLQQPHLTRDSLCLRDFLDKEALVHFKNDFLVTKERLILLEILLSSQRFADLSLSYYANEISPEFERQFAAMVLSLPSLEHTQVIFRGTDDSLIGWQEDFRMTYMREIPAQRMASRYLADFLKDFDGQVVVSGHSKGGNLAVYASSHLLSSHQEKISAVYMFDAPGLHPSVLASFGYGNIQSKILAIRPKESIVGVMLTTGVEAKIVDSVSFGINQHNVANWQLDLYLGQFIEVSKGTDFSLALEKTFKTWNEELSSQELKIFFDTFFNLFMDNGIDSLNDFSSRNWDIPQKLGHVMTDYFRDLDDDKRRLMRKSLTTLVSHFAEHSLENTKETISSQLPDFLKHFQLPLK
ncbi:Mbeg1-like protein [Streptococcus orisasini]|uniref:Mbeg1-like protein n=1 Tax=Streptococcus orisasini TaxID=1080071 RepID=UPI00070D1EE9|nr:Mbeg1-like protein [Streptococcus orisasini]